MNEPLDVVVCSRCVMDSSIPHITFDENGCCSYCSEFLFRLRVHDSAHLPKKSRDSVLEDLRSSSRGKPYDCVIGISGGLDSSYLLLRAVELGLKPIAVHMDNGWNSELAQSNISQIVRGLGVDLETHVISWPVYRSLMQAFFDADVIDVELLYDNAALGATERVAQKYNLRFILSGENMSTEGMMMPPGWNWFKRDRRNIRSIARAGGVTNFDTFPFSSPWDLARNGISNSRVRISLLDFEVYSRENALRELESKLGYKRYPYKHYESVFTRFYQGFLLPEKFGVDKRKLHLSSLVVTQQMSRAEAIHLLSRSPYPDDLQLLSDTRYFLKKMGWSEQTLSEYLLRPARDHGHYANDAKLLNFASKVKRIFRTLRFSSDHLY